VGSKIDIGEFLLSKYVEIELGLVSSRVVDLRGAEMLKEPKQLLQEENRAHESGRRIKMIGRLWRTCR
jgi:hypothetical protein